ncbi:MAG: UDP-N-acetylmuramoyl-L-alanyl-D-glutamate--2,6-diaminopimelate ligase [Xanthomonadales bacterium]|nr:UDP-N-acetylmuramoyl-L-alanyl-D-glutamate--2,6-diaminopimelate ligase [Xanthomonadales bacterium]
MSLRMLLEGWLGDPPDIAVAGLDLDSRRVESGHAFVAVEGAQGHGLDYVSEAVERGCVAVIHDGKRGEPDVDVPCVAVPELADRLGQLACRFWAAPSDLMTIAGVTGTNGKTSVAHFLAQSWQRRYGHAGIVGTLGYGQLDDLQRGERTTPDVLRLNEILARCLDDGVERVAMEVSSHALEQGRVQTVQFDAAVFTNLSRDHLDYHRDMEAYAASKKRLFTEFAPQFAIINHDDMTGRAWIGELDRDTQVLGYGLAPGAELGGEILGTDADGMYVRVNGPWGKSEFRTGLIGAFNVSNLLATAGTLSLLGMDWDEVIAELEMMTPVPGRMLRLGGEPGQPVVVIDYAHTPDALAHALQAVRAHLSGRLTCVFGCGGNRDRGKRPEMGRAAASAADRIVVTSDNPRFESVNSIINDVLGGIDAGAEVEVEPDRAAAIARAITSSGPGDIVLVAGKGHETYQEIAGQKLPFSDEAVVRAVLEKAA